MVFEDVQVNMCKILPFIQRIYNVDISFIDYIIQQNL